VVVTPEAVRLDLRPVGVAMRTLAKIIDLAVLFSAWLVVVVVAVILPGGRLFHGLGLVVVLVSALAAVVGYPIAMETATRGRTVGKIALGLRTSTVEGLPIGFRQAAIRGVFELVDLWATLGGVGMATIVWTANHQRLGDLFAGTVVLRERIPRSPSYSQGAGQAVRFWVPRGMEAVAASLDVSRVDEGTYELVRSYLTRWTSIEPLSRQVISRALADRLAALCAWSPRPSVTPDEFVATVAACYQARAAGLR
jgi:uncharacterized RDD family membrane protein YckC